jgi:hypothetical protein
LRSQKKHGVRQPADEHFSDKRNEELSNSDLLSDSEKIGVFLLTLNNEWLFYCHWSLVIDVITC